MTAAPTEDTVAALGLVQHELREAETRRADLIRWRRTLARRAYDEGIGPADLARLLGVTPAMAGRLQQPEASTSR